MEKTTGRIIKSQDIQCDGQYFLNMERTNHKSSQNHTAVTGVPKAQIIENKNVTRPYPYTTNILVVNQVSLFADMYRYSRFA